MPRPHVPLPLLNVALAALAGLAIAAPAAHALDVERPAEHGGVRYAGPFTTWEASFITDAPVTEVKHWVTGPGGGYGSEAQPRTTNVFTVPLGNGSFNTFGLDFSETAVALVDGQQYVLHLILEDEVTQPFTADTAGPPALTFSSPASEVTTGTPAFEGAAPGSSSGAPDRGTVSLAVFDQRGQRVARGTGEVARGAWSAKLDAALAEGGYAARVTRCDEAENCTDAVREFRVVAPQAQAPRQDPVVAPSQSATGTAVEAEAPPTAAQLVGRALDSAVGLLGGDLAKVRSFRVPVAASGPGRAGVCLWLGKVPGSATCLKPKAARPRTLVALGRRTFAAAGEAGVAVKATRQGRKRLKGRKPARVVLQVVFQPAGGGAPVVRTRRLTLARGGG